MQRQTYKNIKAAIMRVWHRLTGRRRESVHPNPLLRDPYQRERRRGKAKKRPVEMKLEPGTIRYHDWLVRELGYDRRLADGYQYAYLNGYDVKMPKPGDLRTV